MQRLTLTAYRGLSLDGESGNSAGAVQNLEMVHAPKLTKQNLKSFLASATGLRAYQRWMVQTILDNTEPGQKVLVVCHKQMIAQEYIPNWPRGDEHFQQPEQIHHQIRLGSRRAVYPRCSLGMGAGSNAWQECEAVVLCGSFICPNAWSSRLHGPVLSIACPSARFGRTTNRCGS